MPPKRKAQPVPSTPRPKPTAAEMRALLIERVEQFDTSKTAYQEFMQEATTHDPWWAVRWNTERVLLGHYRGVISKHALAILQNPDLDNTEAITHLRNYTHSLLHELLTGRSWESRSTSPIANLESQAEASAKARWCEAMGLESLGRDTPFTLSLSHDTSNWTPVLAGEEDGTPPS